MNFDHTLFNDRLTKIVKNCPELMDQWVLVVSACHQYTTGITGQNFYARIVFAEYDGATCKAKGFDKKGDWRRALDSKYAYELTKRKINGRPTPYGEVGAHYRIVKTYRFKDIIYLSRDGKEYFFKELNRYFHYSTPTAIAAVDHAPKATVQPAEPAAISA